jgi:PhzF family phenazine biosynthesis protein
VTFKPSAPATHKADSMNNLADNSNVPRLSSMTVQVQQLSAFPFEGRGGNPAGVVLNGAELADSKMQGIAAQVGYSETVFITKSEGFRLRVRYFSPEMEVDFCGHATIAAGVALGEVRGSGEYVFETNTGQVAVRVSETPSGFTAELTSHTGTVSELGTENLAMLLEILGWQESVLAKGFVPLIANAGNSHPILVLDSIEVLQNLNYDFEALQKICREKNWPTVQIVAEESPGVWQSRNPFAFGGVYEDPATGSAALAFAVYLRETQQASPGDAFQIKQGFDMGQPCLLSVAIHGIHCSVSGGALKID